MADAGMIVEVVTPEQGLFEEAATAIVLRTSEGDLTVLPGHTPLVADVAPGVVRVEREEADSIRLAVHGGFLHVDTAPGAASGTTAGELDGSDGDPGSSEGTSQEMSTRVRLLAGIAELSEQIDVARAQEAKTRAEARAAELRSAGVTGTTSLEEPSSDGASAERISEEDLELDEADAATARATLRIELVEGPESGV